MILSRRVALNGNQLDQVDSRIVIRGIDIAAGKEAISAEAVYGGAGSWVTSRHRDSLDITVRFAIRLKKGSESLRSRILEDVNSWAAGGGWLTVSSKEARQICVIAASLPGDADARDWTREYAIIFRAYGVPYWQETEGYVLRSVLTNSGSWVMIADGNTDTVVDVSYQNGSGSTINQVDISCGGSTFQLVGLGLQNGESLEISHPDDGAHSWLEIQIKSTGGVYRSAMGARTIGSSDDLKVSPGRNTLSVAAAGRGSVQATVRGRFQ